MRCISEVLPLPAIPMTMQTVGIFSMSASVTGPGPIAADDGSSAVGGSSSGSHGWHSTSGSSSDMMRGCEGTFTQEVTEVACVPSASRARRSDGARSLI
jgi:hypothetical protein